MSCAGPNPIITASSAPSSTIGMIASSQKSGRAFPNAGCVATAVDASRLTARLLSFEEAHPPQLRELTLMRVKHEVAGIAKGRLENRSFALAQRDRIGMVAGFGACARTIGVEEHSVEMEA